MAFRSIALAIACFLAPVIAVIVGTIAFSVNELHPGDYSLGLDGVVFVGAWLGIVVGVPTMLLIGLPLHAYFQRRGMIGLPPYALGGALAGGLAALTIILAPPLTGWRSWSDMVSRWADLVLNWEMPLKVLIFGALTGVLAAAIFWLLWPARQPAPNPPTSPP